MDYIAHIRNRDGKEQLLRDHLLESMKLAEKLGEKIGLSSLVGLAALLHDLGKFSKAFQDYLRAIVANPDAAIRGSVDHSTAGGRLLYRKLHNGGNDFRKILIAEIIGNAIISHHSSQGLLDMLDPKSLQSDYLRRVETKDIDEFEAVSLHFFAEVMSEEKLMRYVHQAANELDGYLQKNKTTIKYYNLFFLNKFIYSCLIDADRINTMVFEENKELAPQIKRGDLFGNYYDKLSNHLTKLKEEQKVISKINKLREDMSQQCDDFAKKNTGIYTLSIPTGGGKTLASLRFALKHARLKGKERIIYIVPYTTVIEQNAKTVREILQDDENILEHHSNVIEEDNKNVDNENSDDNLINYISEKNIRLTKDNWESPIIFTTMVQFLEVIYGSGTRRIRRFHNLTNAVIIFDEVQAVPLKCVSMFNEALNYLEECMNSTLILCTATQPALNAIEKKLKVSDEAEMISNIPEIIGAFKRTEIVNLVENAGWSIEKLVDFIKSQLKTNKSILTILNTTTAVRKTFCLIQYDLSADVHLYHLSTLMCPAHRKDILDEIRQKLENGERVLCISTQLIEAGVDISFECVIRSLAGCDSIAQAAGRCNRNGESSIRNVFVVKLNSEAENLSKLHDIKRGQYVTLEVLNLMAVDSSFGKDILSQKVMNLYFEKYYYESRTSLDYKVKNTEENLIEWMPLESKQRNRYLKSNGKRFPLLLSAGFKSISRNFQVIDNPTTSVLVPYGEKGKTLIADLNGKLTSEELTAILKKAQQYSVNLYKYQIDKLRDKQLTQPAYNSEYISILLPNAYSDIYGVDIDGEVPLQCLNS